MAKKRPHKCKFDYKGIKKQLTSFEFLKAYSFTKRDNKANFDKILSFLPDGYVNDLADEIQNVELIISGSTQEPYQIGIMVGRLDRDKKKGTEQFDIDVWNIVPEHPSSDEYYTNQFQHFAIDGKRTTTEIAPFFIPDDLDRTNHLYSTYLTGSTTGYTMEEYDKEKPYFIKYFKKSLKR